MGYKYKTLSSSQTDEMSDINLPKEVDTALLLTIFKLRLLAVSKGDAVMAKPHNLHLTSFQRKGV